GLDPLEVEAHDYSGSDTEITIPNTVSNSNTYTITSIGVDAFRNKGLTSVTITDNVTEIGSYAFYGNELTSIAIPDNVTSIGRYTFRDNQLTNVTIPYNVTEIGEGAFLDNQLTRVTVLATTPPTLVSVDNIDVFFTDPNQIDLIVPNGTEAAYEEAVGWTGFRSTAGVGQQIGYEFTVDGITYQVVGLDPLEVEALDYDGTAGTDITIPATVSNGGNTYTVTSIGNEAFMNKGLTSVTITDNVTSFGNNVFRDNQLTSVEIPESVTNIEYGAFKDNQLTSVTIHNTVTDIGTVAFDGNELTSIDIPNSVTSIGRYTFRDNQLTHVTIPNSVTRIGEGAFLDNQLTRVTVLATTPPTFFGVDNIDVFFY
ncbi:MAG: leucine-rich repeat domain-containing protein, partial [Hyphomicrobiales bacterium]